MSKLPNELMSRRRLLARVALGVGLAYAAPAVAGLDLAHASTAGSGNSGGNSGGSRGGNSGASRGGNSGASRGNSKPSKASKPSRASRGNSRGGNSRSDRSGDKLLISRGNSR